MHRKLLVPLFDAFLNTFNGDYSRYQIIHANPNPEELRLMEKSPSLFTGITIAKESSALNVADIDQAYKDLKTHRVVGKLVLTVGK